MCYKEAFSNFGNIHIFSGSGRKIIFLLVELGIKLRVCWLVFVILDTNYKVIWEQGTIIEKKSLHNRICL